MRADLLGRLDIIVIALGLLSAVIDNVPLVAATMGMYSLTSASTSAASPGLR
ncbi:hypothetical protein [Bradyrhizobium sp. Leo121]|uniref:hypothetical protein n=1 Tax=Bradyrhizobium sp. Leo121 TaxID=1571195 RepID=UPI0013EF0EBD|nr:hypothetical protein [Bradyrhizobium sp. Leo121]